MADRRETPNDLDAGSLLAGEEALAEHLTLKEEKRT